MRKLYCAILALSVILGCKNNTAKIEPPRPLTKVAFKKFFHSSFKSFSRQHIDGYTLDSIQWVDAVYKDNDHMPIWITDSLTLSDEGQTLIGHLLNARNYGLQTQYYPTQIVSELANKLKTDIVLSEKEEAASTLEPLLSYSYMLFGMHLNKGILTSIDSLTVLPRKQFTIDMPRYLIGAYQADSLMAKLLELQPKQVQYKNLQKALEAYLKRANLSTNNVEVIPYKEDSLKAIELSKQALELHGYFEDTGKDSTYIKALQKFQTDHGLNPDGVIGKNTARALSVSPYEYYQKIVASLERWRWKNSWNGYYLYVNIPSFKLQLFKDGKPAKEFVTVVGAIKNETPEIADTLEYIIAYPYWHVPNKIAVEEVLVKAKKDSTYLERNNFDILNSKREILDPKSIDWSKMTADNFNYSVRQEGGSSNSLGYVKFIFPNKYSIYLHDTPTKYYFSYESRAYSHGCVRVQHALDLADFLLENDENRYTLDSIKSFIDRRKERAISLNHKIPIYIYYVPTVADSLGNIIFYEDVYGLDNKLIQRLVSYGKQ